MTNRNLIFRDLAIREDTLREVYDMLDKDWVELHESAKNETKYDDKIELLNRCLQINHEATKVLELIFNCQEKQHQLIRERNEEIKKENQ